MKKKSIKIVSIIMILSIIFSMNVFAKEETPKFDEYGFNISKRVTSFSQLKASSIEWTTFETKEDVPLDKFWTINFSKDVQINQIEAIVIERNEEFIPVRIVLVEGSEVAVVPVYGFSGDTEYTLKIFLENGKNYKMNFRTVAQYREADKEANNNYLSANKIYTNEIIQGDLTTADSKDYYKIILAEDGELNLTGIQMNGGEIDLMLFGERGSDIVPIAYDSNKTTTKINKGLEAGVYYVLVLNSGQDGRYQLENTFSAQTVANDNAGADYINAKEIEVNTTVKGHLGYTSSGNVCNETDFYKIDLEEHGNIEINIRQLDGGVVDVYLYGENGNDGRVISSVAGQTTAIISEGLQPGNYYIKINYSNCFGGYTMTNHFSPQAIANKNTSSSYINAPTMELDSIVQDCVGYFASDASGNFSDYYKIEVPRSGTLELETIQLDGGKVDMYLYGSQGDDAAELIYDAKRTTARVSKNVVKGTYYVKIYFSGYYGAYQFKAEFN